MGDTLADDVPEDDNSANDGPASADSVVGFCSSDGSSGASYGWRNGHGSLGVCDSRNSTGALNCRSNESSESGENAGGCFLESHRLGCFVWPEIFLSIVWQVVKNEDR